MHLNWQGTSKKQAPLKAGLVDHSIETTPAQRGLSIQP
jgi:hypothetical protein